MEVNAPVALPPRKELTISIGQEAGWAGLEAVAKRKSP
jgi:hypothetical protein